MKITILASLLLVACTASQPRPQPQPEPRPAQQPSAAPEVAVSATPEAPLPSLADLGGQIVDWLREGKHDLVRQQFDAAMNQALPNDEAVKQMWLGVEAKLGKCARQAAVNEWEEQGYRVVHVTCAFELMPMDVRLVFDKERRLGGLFVQPAKNVEAFGPRPQTPKKPFPYEEREVLYDNPKDGSKIGGSLTLPQSPGPHPAVLLVTGSGAQDRDETIAGHKPFLVIADHLTRQGFAVLRVDDRGVGKTTGDPKSATIETHATDAEAGIAFLAAQKEIDPKRIGIVGHSEGGVIAAIVASRDKSVAFVVSLAGTGLPGSEINPMQVGALLRAKGTPEEGVKAIVESQRKLMKLVAENADTGTMKAALDEALAVATKYAKDDAEKELIAASVSGSLAALGSPWFRSFVTTDPRAYWSKVTVPVLALNGDKDLQVPADENLRAIKTALAKNKDAKTEKLAGLNHLFQSADSGAVEEYARIEETFNPKALERMTEWLRKRANRK